MALTLAEGGGRAGISFDEAAFARVVNRFKNAAEKTGLVQCGLIEWAMTQGIQEAQHQIDTLVYKAPISKSGYVRTGATRSAITRQGSASLTAAGGASGTIHVDPTMANRQGFYYPAVLNRGRTDVDYYPRPFWTATKAIMRVRYDAQGRVALRQLHQALAID